MGKICLITGGSGFLGSNIAQTFEKNGWKIRTLQRRSPPSLGECEFFPWRLGERIDRAVFSGVDTLIHCAYDFSPFSWSEIKKSNVDGSIDLFKKAEESGIKNLIFISSISSFENCVSHYGRAKYEVEKYVHHLGGLVIRPGLVYGEDSKSMFSKLQNMAASLPIVPVIQGGNQLLYLIHVRDLSEAIFTLSFHHPYPARAVTVAHSEPLFFKTLLKKMGKSTGKNIRFISIPSFLVMGGLKILELVGVRLRTRSDSLKGLLYSNPRPDFSIMEQAGIQVQKF